MKKVGDKITFVDDDGIKKEGVIEEIKYAGRKIAGVKRKVQTS